MITAEEKICSIALTQVPGIGPVWGRKLVEGMGSAEHVFRLRKELPDRIPGVHRRLVETLDCPRALESARREYEFIRKNNICCLTLADPSYPQRLRECDDAPLVLYYKGNADLNTGRVLSMVGTRKATEYGKGLCLRFLEELRHFCPEVLVVSGLAYGIDIHSHRAALKNDFPTVGVLAHGLDRIYPYVHRQTAVEMLEQGGLLTEFPSGTNPDRHNFVSRNRIIAGMSDATLVVESAAKGGSLITAEIAGSYHRDCFAFPGRVTDEQSAGCNHLLRDHKAALIESAEDLVLALKWVADRSGAAAAREVQASLFADLTPEEEAVVSLLKERGEMQINMLVVATDIPVYQLASLLFEMEMKGLIRTLAGGMYRLG